LQPGDLVFFRTGGFLFLFRRRHVGVYLANGEFAHASGTKGVATSRLDEPFWKRNTRQQGVCSLATGSNG
jgi:cell wall-associated NlpC family hydrolase